MKFLVCLSCVLAVAVCSPTDINEWEDFKNLYGKSYETQEEEAYRNSVFKNSQKIVEEHNAKFDQGLISYNLKINEHADRTWEEFSATMKGLIMGKTQSVNVFQYDKNAETNHTVDWRTKGAVTPVKNQQQCGSCWAFSTTGSLEGQHFLKTNKLVSLSEQNLVDCSMDFGNFGCMGGLMDNAFKYIKSNKGIDTEDSYPYEAKNGKCRFDAKNVGATITGYTDIPKGDEKALQHAVDKVGPISVAIDASGSEFQLYHSGVYYNKDCSSTQLDHGVLAVGLGEEDGKKYWLVKNSWGQSWGQDGYIMMSRDKDNNCGIATSACFPLV